MQDYTEFIDEILVAETSIQQRVRELGTQISRDYAGEELLVVCVLRGAITFTADLTRQISVPHGIDFMAVSSYGTGARSSTGNVRLSLDLQTNIEGKNVMLVEDIIDSGRTISHVLELLSTRNPKSLKVCALLDKVSRREVEVPIDYRGFDIADKFVFGYGLDLDEHYRNLPFVAVVDVKRYKAKG